MRRTPLLCLFIAGTTAALTGLLLAGRPAAADEQDRRLLVANNDSGQVRTFNVNGEIDLNNPFFRNLGSNGRSCFSCHRPDQGWTITPDDVQRRFDASRGMDPIFRTNDGSNCKGADVSTLGKRRRAFSLLRTRGLIRIGLAVPADAEFVIDSVDDPYECGAPLTEISAYRRPLPSTSLRFLTAVMWDGRESTPTTTILEDLTRQANNATLGHAEAASDITAQEAQDIVAFETGIFTAQARDDRAGSLRAGGATGGPVALSEQPFHIGINDPVGLDPTGTPFDPNAFTLFSAWADGKRDARAAIARGQALFNSKQIVLTGVAGLNNQTFPNGVTVPEPFTGTCTTCHDTPNVGNHSVKAPLNIGLTDAARRTPDMPLYTLRRISTGETVQTTDPGRAMITGKWADISKFKGPILRALAARAPYFHNGLAATLEEAVDFYDTRFNIGLTDREKSDLVAFLRAL